MSGQIPPVLIYTIENNRCIFKDNIMFYGHLDRLKEEGQWDEGLGPNNPQIKGDNLFGRGVNTGVWNIFSILMAVKAAHEMSQPSPRIVIVMESEQESGSPNLADNLHIAKDIIMGVQDFNLKVREGVLPDPIFCLDGGYYDKEKLWVTSTVRGLLTVDVKVETCPNQVFGGQMAGILPDTFRVMRILTARLYSKENGNEVCEELHTEIDNVRKTEAVEMALYIGSSLHDRFPITNNLKFDNQGKLPEMYLDNTWRPSIHVIGTGLPEFKRSGDRTLTSTTMRLAIRIPPTMTLKRAERTIKEKLSMDTPYNCKLSISFEHQIESWCVREIEPWLKIAIDLAGNDFFKG